MRAVVTVELLCATLCKKINKCYVQSIPK